MLAFHVNAALCICDEEDEIAALMLPASPEVAIIACQYQIGFCRLLV